MSGDATNIRLGTCNLYLGTDDTAGLLGLTIGGVEVEVTTETQPTTVDQYGDTIVKETIRGRNLVVRTQLAETTIDNMVKLMPGAEKLVTGGERAVVKTGVGIDLLAAALPMWLRPKNMDGATPDKSEDFYIPLVATAGGVNFAYTKDSERVFNVEFRAYPTSGDILYEYGDPAATV
jgi:hypothetical protein